MDEVIVRGLVIGLAFAAVGFGVSLLWKLMRSPSEVARRIKWVLALAAGGVTLMLFFTGSDTDKAFLAGIAGIVIAGVWIAKGIKPKP